MSEFPDRPPIPRSFHEVYGPTERFGGIQLGLCEEPCILWVTVRGWVGKASWQRALDHARAFGRTRTRGWTLVVDSEGAFSFSPALFGLPARIGVLPNLRRTVAFAPLGRRSWMERHVSGLCRPDREERVLERVLAVAAEDGQSGAAA